MVLPGQGTDMRDHRLPRWSKEVVRAAAELIPHVRVAVVGLFQRVVVHGSCGTALAGVGCHWVQLDSLGCATGVLL